MRWIVFDVDGVLIDVSESYDVAVKKTVEYFVEDSDGIALNKGHLRKLRKIGVFGDDYRLSETLIAAALTGDIDAFIERYIEGKSIRWVRKKFPVPFSAKKIEQVFDTFYLGDRYDDRLFDYRGLWKREKPIVRYELLMRAKRRYRMGVVTGRSEEELEIAQELLTFDFDHRVTREFYLKPDPDALYAIVSGTKGVYIGDSKTDEMMVERYNEIYGEFDFLMVGRDVEDVNVALETFCSK